jgi:hypothetical protein
MDSFNFTKRTYDDSFVMTNMTNMSESKRICIEVEETNKRKCIFSEESKNKHVKPNVISSEYNLFHNGSLTSHDDFCISNKEIIHNLHDLCTPSQMSKTKFIYGIDEIDRWFSAFY